MNWVKLTATITATTSNGKTATCTVRAKADTWVLDSKGWKYKYMDDSYAHGWAMIDNIM